MFLDTVSLTASSVLVDGVMEDVAVSVGDNASFTCKVQSQHSSLSVVWARRLQADQRMVPDTTFGLIHIGEDLYKVGSSLYKVLHILYLLYEAIYFFSHLPVICQSFLLFFCLYDDKINQMN